VWRWAQHRRRTATPRPEHEVLPQPSPESHGSPPCRSVLVSRPYDRPPLRRGRRLRGCLCGT
jgi:hypothetical protein